MAEERTLGLARAQEQSSEDLSKEELQRRLNEARGSISNTVTEIKESVANQVQAVKETLDWREQFKKRPIAWTAGAAGVGFLVGYGVTALVKGDDSYSERYSDRYSDYGYGGVSSAAQSFASPSSRSSINEGAGYQQASMKHTGGNGRGEDNGPGLFERLTSTPAYEKVRNEAGSVAESLMQELSNTAKTVVVPALIKSVKDFLGGYLPGMDKQDSQSRTNASTTGSTLNDSRRGSESSYQPVLEPNRS